MKGFFKFFLRLIIFQYPLFVGISQYKNVNITSKIFKNNFIQSIHSFNLHKEFNLLQNILDDDFKYDIIYKIYLICLISSTFCAIFINIKICKIFSSTLYLFINFINFNPFLNENKDQYNISGIKKELILSILLFLGMNILCVLPKKEIKEFEDEINNCL